MLTLMQNYVFFQSWREDTAPIQIISPFPPLKACK